MACTGTCTFNGHTYAAGASFRAGDGCNTCTCDPNGTGGVACTFLDCGAGCTVDGVRYPVGASVPGGSCEACTCGADGEVHCLATPCAPCRYDGVFYGPGESFPDRDGCNTCTCMSGGEVACTDMACADGCVLPDGQAVPAGAPVPSPDACTTCVCDGQGNVVCARDDASCACDPASEHNRHYVADAQTCMVIDLAACPENTDYFSNACGCGCEQSANCPQWFNCMPSPDGPPCDVEAIHRECPYSGIAY
ncbi:MAG: hypothetical protein H6745_11270 [Deltaproteobacteria bacterium]|nr:hypothetical protein [Deltaproteobacteria bacterium]